MQCPLLLSSLQNQWAKRYAIRHSHIAYPKKAVGKAKNYLSRSQNFCLGHVRMLRSTYFLLVIVCSKYCTMDTRKLLRNHLFHLFLDENKRRGFFRKIWQTLFHQQGEKSPLPNTASKCLHAPQSEPTSLLFSAVLFLQQVFAILSFSLSFP